MKYKPYDEKTTPKNNPLYVHIPGTGHNDGVAMLVMTADRGWRWRSCNLGQHPDVPGDRFPAEGSYWHELLELLEEGSTS